MYKKIFVLIGMLLLIGNLHAQTEEDWVKAIRGRFAEVNNAIETYDVSTRELNESSEGGEATYYHDQLGKLTMIKVVNYGEMGNFTIFYYFDSNEDLIFVFSVTKNYDAPLSGKVVSTDENRYYFHDNELFRWLDNKKASVSKSSKIFLDTEDEINDNLLELMLRYKIPSGE